MSTHQSTGPHFVVGRAAASAADPNHGLNVRVLRFRHSPHREEPALLAHDLLEHGRHEDALALLDIALARDPGDADLELLRGRALLGVGDVTRAQETLIRAAKAAPEWAAPLTWLTRALSVGEGSSRAGAVARRARSLGADDTQVLRLAKSQETADRLDARLSRYETSPDREEPVMLARELSLADRKADASRVLRAALDRDQEDPDTLAALAQLERTEGRPDQAIALLLRARSVAPGWQTVERALFSLCGAEVVFDESVETAPVAFDGSERERATSVLDLEISIEAPVERAAVSAADIDGALDALLAARPDQTVPYAIEATDTEHGLPAIDSTLVGMPVPTRTQVAAAAARPELGHGRIRRAGASGWPRRVLTKPEPTPAPYVRVLVGDARLRARA